MSHQAHFRGSAHFEWLGDGRRMKLLREYAFVDGERLEWPVPKDAIIDGASIPRVLWGVTGGPYEGRYRNASVVHDWYCDVRIRPWQHVHRMFYEAMLVSGVSAARARIMYAAVHYAGPRWSETVIANSRLASKRRPKPGYDANGNVIRSVDIDTGLHPADWHTIPRGHYVWRRTAVDVEEFARLAAKTREGDPSPRMIEEMIDREVAPGSEGLGTGKIHGIR